MYFAMIVIQMLAKHVADSLRHGLFIQFLVL